MCYTKREGAGSLKYPENKKKRILITQKVLSIRLLCCII